MSDRTEPRPCPACKGRGSYDTPAGLGGFITMEAVCKHCDGTGEANASLLTASEHRREAAHCLASATSWANNSSDLADAMRATAMSTLACAHFLAARDLERRTADDPLWAEALK